MPSLQSTPYKCIIIDDDQISIDILKGFISRTAGLTTLATYTDPIAGIEAIWENGEIDFLFLDINMEVSGIDVAKVVRDQVKYLIFVTSHEKYALEAFRVYCDKFLVKPVTYDQIYGAISDMLRKESR